METEGACKDPGIQVLEALEAVEPAQAMTVLSTLADDLHASGQDGLDLNRAWASFKQLLQRRGYFVETPDQLSASLREIQDVGAGFDLFDLARSLARYDLARTTCRKLAPAPALPELRSFASNCVCGKRRKGKNHA